MSKTAIPKPRNQWGVQEIIDYAREGEAPTWDRAEALRRVNELGREGRDDEVDEILDGLEAAGESNAGNADTTNGDGPPPSLEDMTPEDHARRKYGKDRRR